MAAKKTGKKVERRASSPERETNAVQAVLRKTEKNYPAFFDHAPVATVIIDENSTVSLVNRTFEELSGYTRKEVEGKKKWMEFVSSDDAEKLEKYHSEFLRAGGWAPSPYSVTFVSRDGSTRDMSVVTGQVPGTRRIIVSLVDITARKKLEQMLRVNEERYHTLVKNIGTGVFRTTCEHPGKFVWANAAFLSLFGFGTLADLLKYRAVDLYVDFHDRDQILADLHRTGHAENPLIRMKKTDGTLLYATITAQARRNTSGAIEWIDGTVEDLTDVVTAQERFREIMMAASPFAIMTTDVDGVITAFGAGSEKMLGYTAADVTGKATPLIFLTESGIATRSRMMADETGRPVIGFDILSQHARIHGSDEREWTCIRRDGPPISVALAVTAMKDTAGTLTGYLCTAQEITNRKRVEEAFRLSSLQMSGVIYNLPDATFAIDREGKVIAWNRAIEDLTGVKSLEILGKGNYEYALAFYQTRRPMLIDLVSSDDRKIEDWDYTGIQRTRNSLSAEITGMTPRGRSMIMRGVAAPIYDEFGNIAGAIETLMDITELKKTESALQDTASRYRAILDNTGAATAIIEEDSTITYINPEFEKILGYIKEEIEGKQKWTEFVSPEDLERMQAFHRLRRIDPRNAPAKYELRFIRWDGEVRNGLVAITLIPETRQSVISLLDITDKIQAENACQRANRKLNFFNSTTRHEILNQLTVLKGNLELALERTADADTRVVLEKELAAAEAIESQVLFTRDYQDIGLLPPQWQDLMSVIRKACTGIQAGPVDVEIDIVGVEVFTDKLLERVFYHMVDNAIRYGEKISRIHISCNESFEELLIVCEDNGIGIPPDAKEKIFNHQYYKDKGLDMYLAREILSLTGISIRETGAYGKGARFELHVPKGAYRFTVTH
ncbi:MAG: PAS domain S-box protein [Methanoregula sp.]|jgi:PAS domain S-box-containing protein|uniref:PAS domain S-box protein n=1 Tax=Methanoregula sp. TaxID=2052170 RepID=UPI003C275CCC